MLILGALFCGIGITLSRGKSDQNDLVGAARRIVELLKSFGPGNPFPNASPWEMTGGMLDVYIETKPADTARFLSIAEYAAGRLRGAVFSRTTPDEASRQLFSLADALARSQGIAGAPADPAAKERGETAAAGEGLALFARYHARKILAGTNLALFYRSGDASALRTARLHASAGLEIWQRLAHLTGRCASSGDFFSGAGTVGWSRGYVLVRHDIDRLVEVEQMLDRYGLFDLGLDFGPRIVPAPAPYGMQYAISCSLERRFSPLDPQMAYSPARGYGWLDGAGITASPPRPVPGISPDESSLGGMILPFGALYRDFLRGTEKSELLVDLPDGEYRVTSIVANQPEIAAGSFQIRPAEKKESPVKATTYALGETGEKEMNVRVTGGKLALAFIPEKDKDWLVNGLVLTRRVPHIGHIPIFTVSPGSGTTLSATVTAPDGVAAAELHLTVNGQAFVIPMLADGLEFSAHVAWPRSWSGSSAAYYITARDGAGNNGRWPSDRPIVLKITE